jgi:ribosome maturation factor RimP
MMTAEKSGLIQRITELGENVAAGTGIEIAGVELKGGGKARLLRVYIDKPGGVTHADCELVSERLGRHLDEEEVIPGDSYTLEVSSPGLDRPLKSARDFERVIGQKVRVVLTQPIEGQTRLEGKLLRLSAGEVEIETPAGQCVRIPLGEIQNAKLKFEW